MLNKLTLAFAISAICVISSFADSAKRTTGQSFALDDKSLPDGRNMTYICVRGNVCDPLLEEEPNRFYGRKLPIEGAIVWLKRNPRCYAYTDAGGTFEIIVENGVLSKSTDYSDDIVYAWHPGYKVAEMTIFKKTKNGQIQSGIRHGITRISDYDTTHYFKLERSSDWQKEIQYDEISLQWKLFGKKRVQIPQKYINFQKPFPAPWVTHDGREVVELDINGTVIDSVTGEPVQYAGVWLKRNPTILALTDAMGRYKMKMEAIGLRPKSQELSDSICISAGTYNSIELPLENLTYNGIVDLKLEKFKKFKKSGDFIEMIHIPKNFFRMGLGITQGGGPGRDQFIDVSMWGDYPVRTVSLPAYSIGKHPITRGQFFKILEWSIENGYDIDNPITGKNCSLSFDPNEPIVSFTWYNAVKWCNAASEMEGRHPCYYDANGMVYRKSFQEEPSVKWKVNGYRLPTRAEWDHAAAGGTHFDHWWPEGYRKIRDYAYVHFDNVAQGLSAFTVHPIGKKKPNPFGLYDITQIGERCWDWNGPYSGDETQHPKGCSRQDAIDFLKSFMNGFYQPERETPQSEGNWGVGALYGDSDWSAIRRRFGNPMDWAHAHGIRVVVSSERGDEKKSFPVVFDRLRGLPAPVDLNKLTSGLEMVNIPKGTFKMGSGMCFGRMQNERKQFQLYDERPEHKVMISAFKMAKYETTLAQWNEVYEWAIKNGYEFDNAGNIGHSSSSNHHHPVVGVNWFDTLKWCNAASEMKGLQPCYFMDETYKVIYRKGSLDSPIVNWKSQGYRLPTEAEWEYAAFGGVDDAAYYWGNFLTRAKDYAWFGGWFGDSGRDNPNGMRDFLKQAGPNWKVRMYKKYGQKMWSSEHIPYPDLASHPVGQKIGNRYGLYDTFGNVAEMCWDRMAPYMLTINQRINPKGPKSCAEVAIFLKNHILF